MNVITICYKDDGTNCFWVLLNNKLQSVMITKRGADKEAHAIGESIGGNYRLKYATSY